MITVNGVLAAHQQVSSNGVLVGAVIAFVVGMALGGRKGKNK